jgi:hypothetical protein
VAGKSALIKFEGGYRPRYKMEHRPENSQNGVQLRLRSIRLPVVVAAGNLYF